MESKKNAHMLAAVMAMVFGEVVMVDSFALSAIPAPAMMRVQPVTPVYTSLQPLTPRIQLATRASSGGMRRRPNFPGHSTLKMGIAISGTGIYLGNGLLANQWTMGVVVNTVLAILMLVTKKYKTALTKEGLLHAWFLGILLWGPLGVGGWTSCVFYLVCGSLVTKVKMAEKEAKGIAEGRGGQRGPENVWGSAATAAVCALLCEFSPWDSMLFKIGFIASLATKLSDTCGSEIGKAYGKTTYLITTFQKVAPGTEGAVSVEGTLAGVVGSIVLGLWGVAVNLIDFTGFVWCIFAAFVACNCESVIGSVFQNKIKWMTNEVVNLINTAIGAAVAMAGYLLLPSL